LRGANEAEFAILISDRWQHQGLGTQLLYILLQVGRDEKLSRICGTILPENHGMQHICRKAGFQLHYTQASANVLRKSSCSGPAGGDYRGQTLQPMRMRGLVAFPQPKSLAQDFTPLADWL
jgi:GNAT superfamily N-acetyltransferase